MKTLILRPTDRHLRRLLHHGLPCRRRSPKRYPDKGVSIGLNGYASPLKADGPNEMKEKSLVLDLRSPMTDHFIVNFGYGRREQNGCSRGFRRNTPGLLIRWDQVSLRR